MKEFEREDLWFSLCGLKFGLCPMKIGNYCPGCGGGEGNQSCKIARCSLEHGKVTYCFQCKEYPCRLYQDSNKYDSFITSQNRNKDILRMLEIGPEAYKKEQQEKLEILLSLLSGYNDGRKKTFFCIAVNLLELSELQKVMQELEDSTYFEEERKQKSAKAVQLLQQKAEERGIVLKLRKPVKHTVSKK